ncbi:hypothetical protein PENTCL1PPCAC_23507, partial [Pristionchus entomophagus]
SLSPEWPSLSYFLFSFSLSLDIVFTRVPPRQRPLPTILTIRPFISLRTLPSKTRPRVYPRVLRARPSQAKRRINVLP